MLTVEGTIIPALFLFVRFFLAASMESGSAAAWHVCYFHPPSYDLREDFDLSVVSLSNTIDRALFPATLHMVINGSKSMYIAVTIASISEDSPK